jgi:hypothetical protein
MPKASQPSECAQSATARITALSPGASPPPVLTPMRRIPPRPAAFLLAISSSGRGSV